MGSSNLSGPFESTIAAVVVAEVAAVVGVPVLVLFVVFFCYSCSCYGVD